MKNHDNEALSELHRIYKEEAAKLEEVPCPDCGRPLEHDTGGVPTYQCHPCKQLWPESFFPKSEE